MSLYKWMPKTLKYYLLPLGLLHFFSANVQSKQAKDENIIFNQEKQDDLFSAASEGDLGLLKHLINQGASINARDNQGCTALHYAARSTYPRKEEVLHYLLRNGADVSIKDIRGLSPLDGLSPLLLTELLSNVILDANEVFRADITALFADIKFDGETLKILELGQIKNGGFRTWDRVFEQGKIWEGLWRYLSSFKLPIVYVGLLPSTRPINKIGITLQQKIAWETFKEVGGLAFSSLKRLEDSSFFKKLVATKKLFDHRSITSYKGILVYKYRDDREPRKLHELESFKKRHPDFLVIDDVSRPFAANKELTDILFENDELKALRPKTKTYQKKYSRSLAQKINENFNAKKYVIKPLNSGRSNGVVVVTSDKLDEALQRITNRTINFSPGTFNYRPTTTMTWSYWKHDKNTKFLVEEYVTSKVIKVNGKPYDPTMRMTFTLHHDKGQIAVNFLECWWKIPSRSLWDHCSLTEKHVSKFRGDLTKLPAEQLLVSDEDLVKVKMILRNTLPKMYLKMLKIRKEMKERK